MSFRTLFFNRLRYWCCRLRTRRRFRFAGLTFSVEKGVLNPTTFRASKIFARAAMEFAPNQAQTVLELGCGCGLASVSLASLGHRVQAVDINPLAVKNTQSNARANNLSLTCSLSDWDQGLTPGEKFTYIVSNPPFLPKKPTQWRREFYGGDQLEVLARVFETLSKRLSSQGRALVITSSESGRERVLQLVTQAQLMVRETVTAKDWGESLYLDLLEHAPKKGMG